MTIEFADPGYDPTLLYIGIGITCIPLVVALIAFIAYFARVQRHSYADTVGYIFLVVAAVFSFIFIGGMGGAGGNFNYQDRVRESLYEALDDAGFSQIEIAETDNDGGPERITGLLDGEPFIGMVSNLDYPKDYTYKVSPLSSE